MAPDVGPLPENYLHGTLLQNTLRLNKRQRNSESCILTRSGPSLVTFSQRRARGRGPQAGGTPLRFKRFGGGEVGTGLRFPPSSPCPCYPVLMCCLWRVSEGLTGDVWVACLTAQLASACQTYQSGKCDTFSFFKGSTLACQAALFVVVGVPVLRHPVFGFKREANRHPLGLTQSQVFVARSGRLAAGACARLRRVSDTPAPAELDGRHPGSTLGIGLFLTVSLIPIARRLF